MVSSMRKQQPEGASNITNAIVSNMGYIIKKVCFNNFTIH